ncbi:MAG: hypothetical protein DWQ10_05705 [Calditrichaeota bacterium]|nr:MAG: hypothetical protein DWQ10_05705 [Calditrichota bacterium]
MISGKVMLDTNVVAKNALIWLEGMDISARSDENGDFQLEVLPGSAQGGVSGYTGTLNLHTYYGNFKLKRTSLALQDGKFIYDSGPVNSKGKIAEPIILQKLVDIQMRLQPSLLVLGSTPQVRIDVTLTAMDDTVSVYFPGTFEGVISPVTIVDQESGEHWTVQTTIIGGVASNFTRTLSSGQSMNRTMMLGSGYFPDKNATYAISPYILLKNQTIPAGLYNDPDGGRFTSLDSYWKLPFEREGDVLTVQESDD